jgi:1-acyl-sn-glycerol-3-phosphate acyltransferase
MRAQNLTLALRAILFNFGLMLIVIILGLISCLIWWLHLDERQRIVTRGNQGIMIWLRLISDINVTVTGLENVPNGPCVILSNHQSAWESFYFQWLFRPVSFVLKRELFWIPFFGWSLATMAPIGIRRSHPAGAMRQVFKLGQERLSKGIKIVIYPEGTRNPNGQLGAFKTGGAALAKLSGVPILPISHDAGAHWPATGWLKYSGTVQVTIGPAIDSSLDNARSLTDKARSWIASSLGDNISKA